MNRYEGVSHLENPACIGHRFKGEFSALPSDRRYPPPHFLALYPSGSFSPRALSSPIFAFCILETADFLTGLDWICPIYCLLDLPSPPRYEASSILQAQIAYRNAKEDSN